MYQSHINTTRFQNRKEGVGAQMYGHSRQCGHPVGALCSMGLGRKPLINGLI